MADATLRMVLVGEDKSASKTLKSLGDEADKSSKKLGGLGTVMGGVLGADFAKAAGAAVVDFGKDSVTAFRDAEAAQRKLEDAYKRYPALADTNIGKLRELNQAIQEKTGADADDLAAAQAGLAQYGLTGEQISKLTPLLDDYATKTGKDLPSAASDLGKAMLGQGRALKDVGVDFKDAGSVGENFDQVMQGLAKNVGGFAEGEASTIDGKLKKMETSFGDVQEAVGAELLPVLTQLLAVGLQVIQFIQRNSDVMGPLAIVFGVVTAAVWALNAAMSANPIGLVVIAIAALVAGLIIAYKRSDTFRNIVDTAFRLVAASAKWMWENAIKPAFDLFMQGLKALGEGAQWLWTNGIKPSFDMIASAAAWLWNNAVAPMIRMILNGFASVTELYASMLRGLSKVPGFEWAGRAADAMDGAAGKARELSSAIRNIPDQKNVSVVTRYTTVGKQPGAATAVATGGYITGPGTGTSDSIPAWLSNGEYVIRAAAVKSLGLDRLDYANRTGQLPRYATGGLVGRMTIPAPAQVQQPSGPMQIVGHLTVDDRGNARLDGFLGDANAAAMRRGAFA